MKQFCLIFLLLLFNLSFAFGQTGEIQGKVTDAETGEAIPFANVSITINGTLVGAQTDFDGFYSIKPVPAGAYDVPASYVGYQKTVIRGVLVRANKITFLDIQLDELAKVLNSFEILPYIVPRKKLTKRERKKLKKKERKEKLRNSKEAL